MAAWLSGARWSRSTKLLYDGPEKYWDEWPSAGGYTTLVCHQPLRPTQPSTLTERENEYQPKCGDVPQLGSKGRYGSFLTCGWQVKLWDSSIIRAIPERFRDEFLVIKCSTNRHFTLKIPPHLKDVATLTCFNTASFSLMLLHHALPSYYMDFAFLMHTQYKYTY